ncbi:MAG: hypothetical protein ACTSQK_06080 [Candidatus Heimdallarchaeota archaeon]
MKNRKSYTLILITIFLSSLSLGFSNDEMKTSAKIDDGLDNNLQPTRLGEIDSSFETHVGMYAFEYLDGTFYGTATSSNYIYGYDASSGASTANISTSITPSGICTDGTNLYTSVYTASQPNGTIIKWDTSGTEISRIHIPIAAGLLGALTWDGNYLWAYHTAPSSLLRINPANGLITKIITLSYSPNDMTWFDDKLWICEDDSYHRVNAYDPNTGDLVHRYESPYHYDSGITNNGTHFMQSNYIDTFFPFEISFTKIPSEPGEIWTGSDQLFGEYKDVAFDGELIYTTQTNSIDLYNAATYFPKLSHSTAINPVGITVIYDNFLLVSSKDAPYNLYTFSLDGTMLFIHSALDVMIRSLAFDGDYVWAMGIDGVLYKLDPADMSIVTEFAVGSFYGITYDYTRNVIWALSQADHTIKYIDTTSGEIGNSTIPLQEHAAALEYGLTFDGEFLIYSTTYDMGHLYRIIPGELDVVESPVTTPPSTNETTPSGGLIPGVSALVEDLIFLGIGVVSASLIAVIIAIIRRKSA